MKRSVQLKRDCRGFTLAEVLASLTLMAVVVPVAMEGVSIASRAGTLGNRKAVATRIAQRVLNEAVVTRQIGSTSGQTIETDGIYQWRLQSEPWTVDALELVTVHVAFNLQGSSYDLSVSTLYDPASSTNQSSTSVLF
ncbi:MAG TPA: prepilin-type N-terminal cleavage/methylation domain-containing protein [Opitutaceae bacterium]|nr:prepilin-type N-terminal cleavage/methylation domain-containing protein [Opitutaceae bacterium]